MKCKRLLGTGVLWKHPLFPLQKDRAIVRGNFKEILKVLEMDLGNIGGGKAGASELAQPLTGGRTAKPPLPGSFLPLLFRFRRNPPLPTSRNCRRTKKASSQAKRKSSHRPRIEILSFPSMQTSANDFFGETVVRFFEIFHGSNLVFSISVLFLR